MRARGELLLAWCECPWCGTLHLSVEDPPVCDCRAGSGLTVYDEKLVCNYTRMDPRPLCDGDVPWTFGERRRRILMIQEEINE